MFLVCFFLWKKIQLLIAFLPSKDGTAGRLFYFQNTLDGAEARFEFLLEQNTPDVDCVKNLALIENYFGN